MQKLLLLLFTFTAFSIIRIGNKRGIQLFTEGNTSIFEYYSPNTKGWIAVGFGTINSTSPKRNFVYYNSGIYEFQNFTLGAKHNNSKFHIQGFEGTGNILLGQQHFHFIVGFPKEEFSTYTEFYFYENTNSYNLSFTYNFNFSVTYSKLDLAKTFDILSDRIEIYSQPWYYVTLALHVLCCFLPFMFGYFQPLRSRGIIPYLVIITITLGFLSEIRTFFYDLDSIFIECHAWGFFIIAAYDISFVIPVIFYLRYFIIIHLKNLDQKHIFEEVDVKGEKRKRIKRHILLLKYVTHPLTSLFFIIFYYFLHFIVVAIILGVTKFQCTNQAAKSLDIAKSILNLVFFSFSFFIIIADIVFSYKKIIKCHFKSYFIDEDPYFYRLEIIQIIPLLILVSVSEILKIQDDTITNRIIHSIAYYYLIYLFLFFPLIITLIKLPSHFLSKKSIDHQTVLMTIFNDEHLTTEFLEFTKKEWNQENAIYYQDVIFKRKSRNWSLEEGRKIYSMYLGSTSLFELNIPSECREKLKKELEMGNSSMEVFDEINNVVVLNLVDTLQRFTQTKEYKKFILGNEIKEKILQ